MMSLKWGINKWIDCKLREHFENEEAAKKEKEDRVNMLKAMHSEPMLNRIGKKIDMTDITYTSEGKVMFKRPQKTVLNNALRRTTDPNDLIYINFNCQSGEAPKQPTEKQEWRNKNKSPPKMSPKLMPVGLPEIQDEFNPMISKQFTAQKPPIYNRPKTEMQQKYTIDVKTKKLYLRKDYNTAKNARKPENLKTLEGSTSEMTMLSTKYLTSSTSELPKGQIKRLPKTRQDSIVKELPPLQPPARLMTNSKSQQTLLKSMSKVRLGSAELLKREFLS
jgi:hypothetical protein